MEEPVYRTHAEIEAARGRPLEAAAAGLWCCGDLSGLAAVCVAIVGTRAATAYGRRLAHQFAEDLGRAGCSILSGLALGIDAAAHEGALSAGTPTLGILGGGHGHFFPLRNHGLAERMLEGGGAVLSPYRPDHPAFPSQFLERNGIVAALADAVVVIEAPVRSGALNTAGWAAGRIPVLAVPGDVDRRHVQGCLALIRDGATLARNAGDVLEALGRLRIEPTRPARQTPDSRAGAVLRALDAGASQFDDIVAASGVPAPEALAALALLELDGEVECCGAASYARVRAPRYGEQAVR